MYFGAIAILQLKVFSAKRNNGCDEANDLSRGGFGLVRSANFSGRLASLVPSGLP